MHLFSGYNNPKIGIINKICPGDPYKILYSKYIQKPFLRKHLKTHFYQHQNSCFLLRILRK